MRSNYSRLLLISLTLILILTFLPVLPAYAAQAITSVVPNQVVNNVSTTITINGSGFSTGSPVVLLNGSAIPTTVANDAVLTATVPAGLPAGAYTVTVSNGVDPDVSCACLTVLDPTPIPPTPVPTATTAPLPFTRPQFVVRQTKAPNTVQTGKEFSLKIVLENAGTSTAYSTQAVFTSNDLVPTKNGGVAALGTVVNDDEISFNQSFYVSAQITTQTLIVVDMTITYYDDKGGSYSDKFTLSIPVRGGTVSTGGSGVYATATPTGVKSSQLVITGYSASVDPLQPGQQFDLKLAVQNVGNLKAQRITMIVGGGSSGTSGGTPQPGGVSGGSGDFANFAPVGASNVQSLGDLAAGDKIQAMQSLIVNVNTNPGAFPMKISFSYLNAQGEVVNDDQVITLLVYSLPNVDISFYRPLDSLFVRQPGALPLQVVNLGKRLAVLGNIKVSAKSGQVDNGSGLVGSLEAGGYFTLDSTFTPEQSGPQTLDISIDYLDDFNQARTITKTVDIEVQEGMAEPTPDPSVIGGGGGGGDIGVPEETTMHKIFRFIKGLFGLDSAWPVWQAPSGGGGTEKPGQTVPVVPSGKGG
jgi:IPT/TIG domain-containing protein